MKRTLIFVSILALTGCAGVRAGIAKDATCCWTGDIVEADGIKKDNWLSFSLFPSVFGGLGFALNGDGIAANAAVLSAGADFAK